MRNPGRVILYAIAFGIVFALAWFMVFLGTWENTRNPNEVGFSWKDWLSVFKNKCFRYYIRIFVTSQMAIDIAMALAVYFLNVSIRKAHLFVPAMAAILVLQLVFIGMFSLLANKLSKKTPAMLGSVVWIAANLIIMTFSPQTPDVVIIAVCSLSYLCCGCICFMVRSAGHLGR